VNIDLASNDTDADGTIDLTSIAIVTGPANGTLSVNANGTVDYQHDGSETTTDAFTYTILDDTGAISNTATVNLTINPQNDPPTTVDVSNSGAEDAVSITITLSGSDVDGTVTEFTLSGLPANGLLYTDAALTTLAVPGTDYAATSEALTLYFVPDTDWNGDATFDYVAKDDDGFVDASAATATITVTPVADAPLINFDPVDIAPPPSTGLVLSYYENLNNTTRAASSIEGSITNAAGVTLDADTVQRVFDGFGTDVDVTNTDKFANDGNTIEVPTGDTYSITGLIYLEAGNSYEFSGYRDDSMRIELGGSTIISTTGDSYGNYGPDFGGSFAPTVSGYYTFEAYVNNVSGPGQFSINVVVNDQDSQLLDANNFNLYASVSDLKEIGAQIGSFTPGAPNTDGGFFPASVNTGLQNTFISLSSISALLTDTDGSETITSIIITDIPVGATLTDGGANTFVATSSILNSVQVFSAGADWDLAALQILVPFDGVFNLNIEATSTETSNNDAATNSQTLTVTALDPATISGAVDTDIDNPDTDIGSNDTSQFINGGDGDDTLFGGRGNDAIHGGSGDDTLTGNRGDDFLAGEEGNDILVDDRGEDILFGGLGSDTMTGGRDADTFLWQAGDGDGSTDIITKNDFDLKAGGDVLDFSDLLQGETEASLDRFLFVTYDSGTKDSTITVDVDGDANYTDLTVVLQHVDLGGLGATSADILDSLIASNNLIVE
jgi:hypothetical protein